MSEANAAVALTQLNDPGYQVFCLEAGDYRSAGRLDLTASGTESNRRFLRFLAADGQKAVQRPERALVESIRIRGSWWVIEGITVQPRNPKSVFLVSIEGGDYNLLDGNLVDASDSGNRDSQAGIVLAALYADPATYNVVQANVVRNGNPSGAAVDYVGIAVSSGLQAGADNDYNEIVDNEVYDWGDGVAVATYTSSCDLAGRPHGTVIDGNDIYVTEAKRIDCVSGAPDPAGECACAENAIDIKPDPGPAPGMWTRVTNNRLWGFRPTRSPSTCGGSGSNGQAITAGNTCAGHVFVGGNAVLDSTVGITAFGPSWIIAGNLFSEMRAPTSGRVVTSDAVLPLSGATDLTIQFNTIVAVDNAYDDTSTNTDTRCNVVIDDLAIANLGGPRGANHSIDYNFLYESPVANFSGVTNSVFATAAESQNTDYCFWRRRWTAPEFVCVPFGGSTLASPHVQADANCDPALGEPFGLGPITYVSDFVPEPQGALAGTASLVGLAALARWRRLRGAREIASIAGPTA